MRPPPATRGRRPSCPITPSWTSPMAAWCAPASSTKTGGCEPPVLLKFLHWLESGEKTADDLTTFCLHRIAESDAEIRAWVEVAPQPPLDSGPLDGIPFGAKDIFETDLLLTQYGSPLYAGRRGTRDAAVV